MLPPASRMMTTATNAVKANPGCQGCDFVRENCLPRREEDLVPVHSFLFDNQILHGKSDCITGMMHLYPVLAARGRCVFAASSNSSSHSVHMFALHNSGKKCRRGGPYLLERRGLLLTHSAVSLHINDAVPSEALSVNTCLAANKQKRKKKCLPRRSLLGGRDHPK